MSPTRVRSFIRASGTLPPRFIKRLAEAASDVLEASESGELWNRLVSPPSDIEAYVAGDKKKLAARRGLFGNKRKPTSKKTPMAKKKKKKAAKPKAAPEPKRSGENPSRQTAPASAAAAP